MILTKTARKKLNSEAKMKIALELGRPYSTIYKWIFENSEKLTLKKNIKILEKFTGLTEAELFEEETETT